MVMVGLWWSLLTVFCATLVISGCMGRVHRVYQGTSCSGSVFPDKLTLAGCKHREWSVFVCGGCIACIIALAYL